VRRTRGECSNVHIPSKTILFGSGRNEDSIPTKAASITMTTTTTTNSSNNNNNNNNNNNINNNSNNNKNNNNNNNISILCREVFIELTLLRLGDWLYGG
jgi:hypothetical protein